MLSMGFTEDNSFSKLKSVFKKQKLSVVKTLNKKKKHKTKEEKKRRSSNASVRGTEGWGLHPLPSVRVDNPPPASERSTKGVDL